MRGLTLDQSKRLYRQVLLDDDAAVLQRLCKEDLFFLLYIACKRKDIDHPWLYDRCREVEDEPYGCLDLWARSHYKSTIITFGTTIQAILCDPEVTIGLFSCTRPIAKAFLSQIKMELESNVFLKKLFPDILWENPQKESPRWSLDDGILVKRKGNPKEMTIEAWGLVDGQPTSKHYKILKYDDVVTRESVSNPEMIAKITAAFELSSNLGDLIHGHHVQAAGTRYAHGDTYRAIMEKNTLKTRIYPATDDGTEGGNPVLLSREMLTHLRRTQGPYVFAAQQLMNPSSDRAMGFRAEWMQNTIIRKGDDWNVYILVDPASAKKKSSDFTVFWVWGLGPDNNYYLLDAVRDRLRLTERATMLMRLHRKWRPLRVGYEQYGMQADIEHIETVMERENYRFTIMPLGGGMAKEDRIKRLIPPFEQQRVFFPHKLLYRDWEGKPRDFIQEFIDDEYLAFPVALHDDMMDCASRIMDPAFGAVFPSPCDPASIGLDGRQDLRHALTTNSEYEVF